MAGEFEKHLVKRVDRIQEDLFVLVLDRRGLEFSPGDCVALYSESGKSRPYSIASGDGEQELRFVIRLMPEGEVSSWLMIRRPGDEVGVSTSFGWFRPGHNIGEASFIFIATGTGIAPFLSCYHSHRQRAPECILYGVRSEAAAVGASELVKWSDLRQAISREKTEAHYHGRLTGLLDALPINLSTHYYLCGLESMISEVSMWLENHGIESTQIHCEVFFHG